jgi:hypothetical protein
MQIRQHADQSQRISHSASVMHHHCDTSAHSSHVVPHTSSSTQICSLLVFIPSISPHTNHTAMESYAAPPIVITNEPGLVEGIEM